MRAGYRSRPYACRSYVERNYVVMDASRNVAVTIDLSSLLAIGRGIYATRYIGVFNRQSHYRGSNNLERTRERKASLSPTSTLLYSPFRT